MPWAAYDQPVRNRDVRKFDIQMKDRPQFWRVLAAIERALAEAAAQQGITLEGEIRIGHSTGEYYRDSVAEAKAVADRNGFLPTGLWWNVRRSSDRPSDSRPGGSPGAWVRVTQSYRDPIEVEVLKGSEVEVNGVFTLLQNSAASALNVPEPGPGTAVSTVTPSQSLWQRVVNHPWMVTVGGGFVLLALGAVVKATTGL